MAYMDRQAALIEEAKARGDKYQRYVPLYDSDGVTVKGRFGMEILA
jgi:hypothetical protein